MPEAARKGDIGTGHACHYPPSMATEGSGDVFINHKPAFRKGDAYAPHGCGSCPAPVHGRKLNAGSATVNVNHRPAGRIGDAIDCGGKHATGSSNVIIGDDSYGGGDGPTKPMFRFLLTQYPGDETFAYRNEPFKLYHNGALLKEGRTTDDGMIEAELDDYTGTFKVEAVNSTWEMDVGPFSPADTDTGFVQRLEALGYGNHSDEIINPLTKEDVPSEIGHFQAAKGEPVSDGITAKLKRLIKAIYP